MESKLQLKLALFGLLKKFEVVKNVRTQLGLSFADLVLQIPAVDLNLAEWTNTFQSNPVLLMELVKIEFQENNCFMILVLSSSIVNICC